MKRVQPWQIETSRQLTSPPKVTHCHIRRVGTHDVVARYEVRPGEELTCICITTLDGVGTSYSNIPVSAARGVADALLRDAGYELAEDSTRAGSGAHPLDDCYHDVTYLARVPRPPGRFDRPWRYGLVGMDGTADAWSMQWRDGSQSLWTTRAMEVQSREYAEGDGEVYGGPEHPLAPDGMQLVMASACFGFAAPVDLASAQWMDGPPPADCTVCVARTEDGDLVLHTNQRVPRKWGWEMANEPYYADRDIAAHIALAKGWPA